MGRDLNEMRKFKILTTLGSWGLALSLVLSFAMIPTPAFAGDKNRPPASRPPLVSQTDAEAGTGTIVKSWTPARVKQAIDALGLGTPGVDPGDVLELPADPGANTILGFNNLSNLYGNFTFTSGITLNTTTGVLYLAPRPVVPLTCVDSTDGNPGALAITPTVGRGEVFVDLTVEDADGCTVTFSEVGATQGTVVHVTNISAANTASVATSAGVTQLVEGSPFVMAAKDTLDLKYSGTEWQEFGRVTNSRAFGSVSATDFYLSHPDVAHGITSITATDDYLAAFQIGAAGGADVYGLTDGDQAGAFRITGIIGAADPTDNSPAVIFRAGKKDGTGWQALGAAESAFAFYNYTTPIGWAYGNGEWILPSIQSTPIGSTIAAAGTFTTATANTGFAAKNGDTSAGFVDLFEDSDNGTAYTRIIGLADQGAGGTLTVGTTFTDAKWCSYATATGFTCAEDAPAGAGDITSVLGNTGGAVPYLFQTWTAFAGADTTPDVMAAQHYATGGADTYSNFDDGGDSSTIREGQTLDVLCLHAAVFDFTSSSLFSPYGADYTCAAGEIMSFKYDFTNSKWRWQNPRLTGTFATDYATPAGVLEDLVTLSGVAANAEHLGAFDGSTITDNQTIKAALQLLETAFEALPGGHDAVTLAASATDILGLSTQEVSFDTQTAATVLAGPATGDPAAPTFRALAATDLGTTLEPTFPSVSLGAAGVKLTGDGDGALTILGLGDGNDENLVLNFDDVENTVGITSGTGVTTIDASTIELKASKFTSGAADGERFMNIDNSTEYKTTGPAEGDISCAADSDTCARYNGAAWVPFVFAGQATGGIVLGDASPDADGEYGYASNAFVWFANSEDFNVTATSDMWTFASNTGAAFTFTPALTVTGTLTANGATTLGDGGDDVKLVIRENTTDATWNGITLTRTCAATTTFGQPVYIDSAGKAALADADAAATMPAIGLCVVAAAQADDPCTILTHGTITHDTWTWTAGNTIYVADGDAGALTATVGDLSDTNDVVQKVAIALSDDTLLVMPSLTTIVLE